jgi:hypothetical protein
MIIPDVPSKLFTTFNKVKYYDEPHKYFVDGKQLISVTTLIHQYEEGFDENYWLEVKSDEYGITQEQVKFAWDFINDFGTTKGSVIHDYAENLFNNKVFPYPEKEIIKKFGYNAIWDEYLLTKKLVDDFYKYSFNKLIPIRLEYVVYDEEFGIGGMVDLLFYNVKAGEFQIWDWKTNKEYRFESDYGNHLKGDLFMLQECEHTTYSLQLSTYKYIIEKNTGIKLGDSYLVWVSANNDKFHVYKAEDYTEYSKIMLNNYKNGN